MHLLGCKGDLRGYRSGDDTCPGHTVGQRKGAYKGMRSTARNTGDGKAVETQGIGELAHVVRPVEESPMRLIVRQAKSGPIRRDNTYMRNWLDIKRFKVEP